MPSSPDAAPLDLEARIRRLEDLEKIRDLRMRYHDHLNERQFDKLKSLFTSDAYVRLLFVWRGTEEIDKGFRSIAERAEFLKQYPHNHRITLHGDTAVGRCDLDARYVRQGVSLIVCGTYHDEYCRVGNDWLFSRLECPLDYSVAVPMDWLGENSNVLKVKETAT